MPLLPTAEVLIARAGERFDDAGRLTDETTRDVLKDMLDKFAAMGRTPRRMTPALGPRSGRPGSAAGALVVGLGGRKPPDTAQEPPGEEPRAARRCREAGVGDLSLVSCGLGSECCNSAWALPRRQRSMKDRCSPSSWTGRHLAGRTGPGLP